MRSSWQFVRLREFFLSFMSFGRQRYFLLPFLFLLLFSVAFLRRPIFCFLLSVSLNLLPKCERHRNKKKGKTRLWTSFVSSTILTQNVTKIKTNHHHHVCTRVRLVLVLRPVGRRSRVDIVQQEEICIQGLCKC